MTCCEKTEKDRSLPSMLQYKQMQMLSTGCAWFETRLDRLRNTSLRLKKEIIPRKKNHEKCELRPFRDSKQGRRIKRFSFRSGTICGGWKCVSTVMQTRDLLRNRSLWITHFSFWAHLMIFSAVVYARDTKYWSRQILIVKHDSSEVGCKGKYTHTLR